MVKDDERIILKAKRTIIPYIASFVVILTIIAAFRLVVHGIGGSDAIAYKFFFEKCNTPSYANYEWFLHQDLLFRYVTKFLRLFTEDYHFYFVILYGINIVAYILFLKEFCLRNSNYTPCILFIFLYWRSFNTLRSNTAIAVMLIALILLYRKKVQAAIVVGFSTVLIHKMAVLYLFFFPFYFIFSKVKLTKLRFVATMIIVIILGSIVQRFFLDITEGVDLGGAYRSYASRSLHSSFWDNGWKIAFEQILLGVCMWLYYKKIVISTIFLNKRDSRRLNLIWMMCLFDMMTIPINFIMGVWRGYLFFYMPRIVMWCEIINLFILSQHKDYRIVLNIVVLTCFIAWMVFRFYNMWEDSNLMPYIFEPFEIIQ